MAKRDGQRVGRVRPDRIGARKLHPHHVVDLPLVRVARADDGLLDGVGRVFGDRDTGGRRHQHRNAPRLPELQRASPVPVDEGHLDRRGLRRMAGHNRGQLACSDRSRSDRASPSDRQMPLATWRNRLPSTSTTPQPRHLRPGSIPMMRMLCPVPACLLPRCIPSARFKDRADRSARPAEAFRHH
jgi:hypothetical protein